MKLKNANKYGNLAGQDLEDFESVLGDKLPQEYRKYLLTYNGGDPSPRDINILDEEVATSLSCMYGLHDGPYHTSLLQVYETYKSRIPSQLLAFIGDDCGNQICIGLTKKHKGLIYFWDHEKESRFFKFSATTLIAESFGQFCECIYEYIDPDESNVDKIIRLEDTSEMSKLIGEGFDVNTTDEYERTPIENCAIHGKNTMIKYLYDNGAKLGSSLEYAKKNAVFFEEHAETVKLITALERES